MTSSHLVKTPGFFNFCTLSYCIFVSHQPPLSSIIKSGRLTFFGRLGWMDENADASQAVFKPPPENWRRPPGAATYNLDEEHSRWPVFAGSWDTYEARDMVQNRPLETDIFAQCYALIVVHAAIELDICQRVGQLLLLQAWLYDIIITNTAVPWQTVSAGRWVAPSASALSRSRERTERSFPTRRRRRWTETAAGMAALPRRLASLPLH